MSNKTRVKSLADELKLSPKDVLAAGKSLNINAKASNSILADEEVGRIKDYLAEQASGGGDNKPREDIIVRRRAKTPEKTSNLVDEVKSDKVEGKTDKDEDSTDKKEPIRTPKAEVKKEQSARIIRPAEPIKKPEAVTPPTQEFIKVDVKKDFTPKVEGSKDLLKKSPEEKKIEKVEPATGGARVISLPPPRKEPSKDNKREFTRPAFNAGSAGKDNKGKAERPKEIRTDRTPRRPEPAVAAAPFVAATTDADARGKRKVKGKRTVEFGEGKRFQGGENDSWMRQGKRNKGRKRVEVKPSASLPLKAAKRKIKMEDFIRVADLAHQMGLKANEIIKVLFNLGVMATINQALDFDTTALVAGEFSYEVEKVGFSEENVLAVTEEDSNPELLAPRPPVVTIMGHVDHGKTSLLDAIRKTSVTTGEAGGITQHIGAYHVSTKKGDIVFLDTPGHEAFTAMRARGAEVTDIVVLVVAADDGVMEQTREAVSHAKAANVPIMVAVNKMDKEQANPDRVKRELSEIGLVAEDWGGETTFSYISAKTRLGLDEFLEILALQAEILELKANPSAAARGHIVEAKLDRGRGALGTVLIQQGTLKVGDSFVCGIRHGRVRAMFDDQGQRVDQAGPSMPVEVQGFEGVPEAGEEFVCLADEKYARRIAGTRALKQRERELAKESRVTLETFLASRADAAEVYTLNLVVKADVQGSLEAILAQLQKLSNEKVKINIIHSGAGAISESDVLLASTSDAIIIGFSVRPNPKTKELAESEKVDIRYYDIIYKLTEEIHSAMEGLLAPIEKEVSLGTAEVRDTFSVPKIGVIAGCHVADGKIVRQAQVRLLRDGIVIFTGKISSLKRFKDDAREVLKGYECGIGIENYNDLKVGDMIEAFEIVKEAATL